MSVLMPMTRDVEWLAELSGFIGIRFDPVDEWVDPFGRVEAPVRPLSEPPEPVPDRWTREKFIGQMSSEAARRRARPRADADPTPWMMTGSAPVATRIEYDTWAEGVRPSWGCRRTASCGCTCRQGVIV